nr:alpha/beta hydrolase [Sphingobium sp. CCH11-B1]
MLDADLWTDVRPGLEAFGRTIDVDTTQDTSIEAIARRALVGRDGPMIVIGFSMGGYVAREIVYQAPDRVKGLALIATSARADDLALSGSRRSAAMATSSFRRLSRGAVAKSLSPEHRTEAMIERVQLMSERLGGDVLERQSQIRRSGDIARLHTISCPTLVIAAGDDELRTIDESVALKDGIAGARFTIVEHSGHLIPLEQPAALLKALAMLKPGKIQDNVR